MQSAWRKNTQHVLRLRDKARKIAARMGLSDDMLDMEVANLVAQKKGPRIDDTLQRDRTKKIWPDRRSPSYVLQLRALVIVPLNDLETEFDQCKGLLDTSKERSVSP